MDTELFFVIVKGISIKGFEDIVIEVIVNYKGEEFSHQLAVKVPIFNSHGQKFIEVAAREAFWKMRKHWGRLNELPPPEDIVAEGDVEKVKAYASSEYTESISE